jgi:hypothetical protein
MTRTNVDDRLDARATGAAGSETDPAEQAVPERLSARPPQAPPGADDWSDPSKLRQMSAIWPLLWLTVPLVLLVLYGLFTAR